MVTGYAIQVIKKNPALFERVGLTENQFIKLKQISYERFIESRRK